MDRSGKERIATAEKEWSGSDRKGVESNGRSGQDCTGAERNGGESNGRRGREGKGQEWTATAEAERTGEQRIGGERNGRSGMDWNGEERRGKQGTGRSGHNAQNNERKERTMGTSVSMSQKIREELAEIIEKNNGTMTPEQVVEYAKKNKDSELHAQFDWNDTVAAKKYRLEQARHIIRLNVVVIDRGRTLSTCGVDLKSEGVRTRKLVSLTSERKADGKTVYRQIEQVLDDKALRAQMLADALAEASAFMRKYRALAELSAVFSAIEDAVKNAMPTKGKKKSA